MKNTKVIDMDYPIFKDSDYNLIVKLDESFYDYSFKSQLLYDDTKLSFTITKNKEIGTNKTVLNLSLDKEDTKMIPKGDVLMDIKYLNGDDCYTLFQLRLKVFRTITEC